jgi:hypothetical protein
MQCSGGNDKDRSENCNQPTRWTVSILIVPLPILCGSHLLRTCSAEERPVVLRLVHEGLLYQMLKPYLSLFLILCNSSLWFLSFCVAQFISYPYLPRSKIRGAEALRRRLIWNFSCCPSRGRLASPGTRILSLLVTFVVLAAVTEDPILQDDSPPPLGRKFWTFEGSSANLYQNKRRHISEDNIVLVFLYYSYLPSLWCGVCLAVSLYYSACLPPE